MYSTRPGLILGFHGCDKSIVNEVVSGKATLKNSDNEYDWLGHGVYFWENSVSRAIEYANYLKENPKRSRSPIQEPAAIGAVLNLGYCLDLLDFSNLQILKSGYEVLKISRSASDFPQNKSPQESNQLMIRELDCAVIETVHFLNEKEKKDDFDSVRGVFIEGEKLYPTAGFHEKDHIQICIRNPNCIKGFFLPRKLSGDYKKV